MFKKKHLVKLKFPLKSNNAINEILKFKTEGSITIEEWKAIIYYMYEKDDATYLENKILEVINKKASPDLIKSSSFEFNHNK